VFHLQEAAAASSTPNAGSYSEEHVFPQWLIKKYQLKTCTLDFPDGKTRRYDKIVVPCCTECNRHEMSDVEGRIRNALEAKDEYTGFKTLSRSDLTLWTAKILYGLLLASVEPWHAKKRVPLPPWMSRDMLANLQVSAMLLDGYRKRVVISALAHPFSILLFQLKSPGPGAAAFDYIDNLQWPTAFAMRMGTAGMIVCFEDFQEMERWYDATLSKTIGGKVLHPVQFKELAARAFYQAGLNACDVRYFVSKGPRDVHLFLKPLPKAALAPDLKRRAAMMVRFTGEQRLGPVADGSSPTTFLKPDGQFLNIRPSAALPGKFSWPMHSVGIWSWQSHSKFDAQSSANRCTPAGCATVAAFVHRNPTIPTPCGQFTKAAVVGCLPYINAERAVSLQSGIRRPLQRLIPILTLSNPRSPNRGARWT
jgi:hypothetical protein